MHLGSNSWPVDLSLGITWLALAENGFLDRLKSCGSPSPLDEPGLQTLLFAAFFFILYAIVFFRGIFDAYLVK